MRQAADQAPIPAVIVGAGAAGLATSWSLKARGIEHRVLEQGEGVGHSWNRVYDSLKLHTGKHMSGLPGMPLPRSAPLFPHREEFLRYLERYSERFQLPIELGTHVDRAERKGHLWYVHTPRGMVVASHLVIATGIISNPFVPPIAGSELYRGDLLHSASYRNPEGFVGKRVLVVGVGNSGAEIATELARAGAHVSISVRVGAHVVPLTIVGIPIQYYSRWMERLPRRVREGITRTFVKTLDLFRGAPVLPRPTHGILDKPPVVGFGLVRAIRSQRVMLKGDVQRLTASGASFKDGSAEEYEAVILATGYRAALDLLDQQVRRDTRGFAERERVASRDQPNLYFVGHNYSAIGALVNIARDSRLTAALVAKAIGER